MFRGKHRFGSRMEVAEGADAWISTRLGLTRIAGRSPTSFLALDRSKEIWRGPGNAWLAYRPSGNVDVILGDPIGPPESAYACLASFVRRAETLRRELVAIAATPDSRRLYETACFRGGECGSEATVEFGRISVQGPAYRDLQRSARHAARAGLTVVPVSIAELLADGYADEFRRITASWLQKRKTGLLSFLVGEPFMPGWESCRHYVVRSPSRVEAYGIFYPVGSDASVYVDITRRRDDSPNGTIDLMLLESFRMLAAEGVHKAYLGMVPCTYAGKPPDDLMAFVMKYAFRYLGGLYPMRGERFFKAKFATSWEARYVFFYPRMTLRTLFAVYRVLWPAGLRAIVGHKLRNTPRNLAEAARSNLDQGPQ